ncbi:MAG: RNA polymerase sigma factor [Cellulomonadaceae bacterium]|jgi:RNA polymerase sigma-70 factor (ECF subfamily)|nr:RNA polymerase sigma factor [Cellulomonadaceae bacterium]
MDNNQARARFTELWLTQHSAVAKFAARRVDPDLVDDIIAETFMIAWQKVELIPTHEKPWLLTIAQNVIATRTRAKGRQHSLALRVATEPETIHFPDELAISRVHIAQAWQKLTEAEREVLALTAWDGLSVAEAAQVLGCLRSTFSVRLTRARRHLKALLNDTPKPTTTIASTTETKGYLPEFRYSDNTRQLEVCNSN